MGHIKRNDMESALVLVPGKNIYDQLNSILNPMIDQIVKNKVQSRTLAAIRDTLLPKLMSGETEVPLAE